MSWIQPNPDLQPEPTKRHTVGGLGSEPLGENFIVTGFLAQNDPDTICQPVTLVTELFFGRGEETFFTCLFYTNKTICDNTGSFVSTVHHKRSVQHGHERLKKSTENLEIDLIFSCFEFSPHMCTGTRFPFARSPILVSWIPYSIFLFLFGGAGGCQNMFPVDVSHYICNWNISMYRNC